THERADPSSQKRYVRLERARYVLRQRACACVSPQEIRKAILGDVPSTLRQEDLEHLLWLDPAKIAWAKAFAITRRAFRQHNFELPEHAHTDFLFLYVCHRAYFLD